MRTSLTVELGGGRRAGYEIIGAGRPLLYFTGGPGENAAILRGDAKRLADTFAVHLIEPHGSGASTPPDDPSQYDAVGHARFYEETRRALGIPRATIMGFSFGAAVALAYAALFPDATVRCIAVAGRAVGARAAPDSIEEMDRGLERHANADWYPEARSTWDRVDEVVAAMTDPRELDAMRVQLLPLYMAHPESPSAQATIAAWRRDLRSNLAASRAWEAGLWEAFDLRSLLQQIRCPTLVLNGELDTVCGPAHGAVIGQHTSEAEVITVADCGHFIPAEKPREFREAVMSFCNQQQG
jgi:pimeloyl-ACP methyl ester carboxylesterase